MQHNNKHINGYCPRCGAPYDSMTKLCSKCGANLVSNIMFKQNKQMPSYEDRIDTMYSDATYCVKALSKRARISGRIWSVIAIIQLVLSIICFPFPFWIAAILNIIWTVTRFKHSKLILVPNKELLSKYDSTWYGLSYIYNILFGGLIGLVGNIYDERTRNYAHANRGLLEWYCNVR